MAEAHPSYGVRPGLLAPATVWSVEEDALVRTSGGRQKRWPLASLRRVVIAAGGRAGVRGQRTVALTFARSAVVRIGSASIGGFGRIEDHGAAFGAFVRVLCAEAARASPKARFESAGASLEEVFVFSGVMLALGLVVIVVSALAMGVAALGVELGARLAFVLCVMVAVRPWLARGGRRFDPRAIPAGLLG